MPTLLVLAAGMGSRYGGLKQLDPMGPHGETVMDYAIFDARRAGFDRVVFIIRRDFEDAFRQQVLPRYAGHIAVDLCFQDLADVPADIPVAPGREKPWGTAHAIRAARAVVSEPFAAINADDFYGRASYETVGAFLSAPRAPGGVPTYAMAGFELRRTLSAHGTVARGVCRTDADGYLTSVRELTKLIAVSGHVENQDPPDAPERLTGVEPVSLNMWAFTPDVFPQIETVFREFLVTQGHNPAAECYIPTVVDALITRGACRVRVLPTSSQWFGVTYRDDRDGVVAAFADLTARGEYPSPLWDRATS
jgi:hypothetical protein